MNNSTMNIRQLRELAGLVLDRARSVVHLTQFAERRAGAPSWLPAEIANEAESYDRSQVEARAEAIRARLEELREGLRGERGLLDAGMKTFGVAIAGQRVSVGPFAGSSYFAVLLAAADLVVDAPAPMQYVKDVPPQADQVSRRAKRQVLLDRFEGFDWSRLSDGLDEVVARLAMGGVRGDRKSDGRTVSAKKDREIGVRDGELRKLWENGVRKPDALASSLKCSRRTVGRRIKELGLDE